MCKPKIRFKDHTEAWEQRKFGELAVRESKCDISTADMPCVEYEDVIANEGMLNKNISLKKEQKKGIIFDGSQILYGKLRPYLHNWLNPDFMGIAVGDWWVLKPVELDKTFLYRLIQTQQFDDIANQSAGSKMPRADWNLIAETEFMVPNIIEEQTKIGEYFDRLDSLITLHQRKCEQTKILKKYMLQKMFPQDGACVPEIRFSGFTEAWEQRKVSDLLQERNEQAPMSEEYPLMAFVANQGVTPKGERYDRSALVNDEAGKKYKRTEYGDFIYSSNNLETGSIGLNKYGNACISPVYSIFKPIGKADLDFLGRRFLRKDFINEMVKWRQGVVYGQWKIHESDFLNIEIAVPSIDEQKAIGQYFDNLDSIITLHQRKCDELKNMKKFMLQNMFV